MTTAYSHLKTNVYKLHHFKIVRGDKERLTLCAIYFAFSGNKIKPINMNVKSKWQRNTKDYSSSYCISLLFNNLLLLLENFKHKSRFWKMYKQHKHYPVCSMLINYTRKKKRSTIKWSAHDSGVTEEQAT